MQEELRDPRRTDPARAAEIAAGSKAIAWYAANVHGSETCYRCSLRFLARAQYASGLMGSGSPPKRLIMCGLLVGLTVHINGCALRSRQPVRYLRAIRLTSPDSPLRLDVVDPGLRVADMRRSADGSASVYARNRATSMELSAALHVAPTHVADCRELYMSRVQLAPDLQIEDVQRSDYNQFAVVAYTVSEPNQPRIGQRNLIACAERDGLLAYIHISKPDFRPADQLLFDALLSSASLSEGAADRLALARRFPVSGHDYLECDMPAGWRSWMQISGMDRPATISIAPPDGDAWEIEITVLWSTAANGGLRTGADLHRLEEANRELGAQAGRLPASSVEDFATAGVIGSFYAAALTSAGAGEFTHVTSGIAKAGELTLTFTISAYTPDSPIFAAALGVIGSARQVSSPGARVRSPDPAEPEPTRKEMKNGKSKTGSGKPAD